VSDGFFAKVSYLFRLSAPPAHVRCRSAAVGSCRHAGGRSAHSRGRSTPSTGDAGRSGAGASAAWSNISGDRVFP
jgi:hypothetical protein